MKFYLDGLLVFFPYDFIYPEQYNYMYELKKALDVNRQGHCLLEMPSGTGKTISLLSLVTSYQLAYPTEIRKIIYCSRTVPEIEKTLEELKRLIAFRDAEIGAQAPTVIALGLSARKNLCIHPRAAEKVWGAEVDALCHSMTASWVRTKATTEPETELCQYYEGLDRSGPDAKLPAGVYTLEDLKEFGRQTNWCPYFLARRMIQTADIVVYSYQYLLDPKIAAIVSAEISQQSVVIFDEAHNIDNVCLEALSVNIDRPVLEGSKRNVTNLARHIEKMKQEDMQRLNDEYQRLLTGLARQGAARAADELLQNPILSDDILSEAVPGNIRKAEHFVGFLKRFIEYLKVRLRSSGVVQEPPQMFLNDIFKVAQIEAKPLKFCSERLASLLKTLEIANLDDFGPLKAVADFATLVATYSKGFTIIIEPYDDRTPFVSEPVLNFCCLDASISVKPVFDRFRNVIVTSGTLSPLEMYPTMLKFQPVSIHSYTMSLSRECFLPLVVTRGSDQVAMSTKFEARDDPSVIRNYGSLVVEMAAIVPDGMVCFFPSYGYMETLIATWRDMNVLNLILKHKLLFVETQNIGETTMALEHYRRACDNGRGAILFSVARGKVSEGIDFANHYGRCVILIGIPYVYTESRMLKARLEFLRENNHIKEGDFLTFDAMRTGAQCVGRVIRGKNDYGIMIFADQRYSRVDKRSKLPQWIQKQMNDERLNQSTDMAVNACKRFLRQMAQPQTKEEQLSTKSLWSKEFVDQQPYSQPPEGAGAGAAPTDADYMVVDSGEKPLK